MVPSFNSKVLISPLGAGCGRLGGRDTAEIGRESGTRVFHGRRPLGIVSAASFFRKKEGG